MLWPLCLFGLISCYSLPLSCSSSHPGLLSVPLSYQAHFHCGPFARYILPIDIHEAFSFSHLGLLQMLLSYLAPLSEVIPPSPCYSSFSNFMFLLFITTGYYIVFYVNIFFFFCNVSLWDRDFYLFNIVSQCLEECLEHSKYTGNICQKDERIFKSEGSSDHQPRLDAWDKRSDLVHWEDLEGLSGEGGGRGDGDGEHM